MLTDAPALMSFLACLTSPRFAAMCKGVSPRSLRLFTFLSACVRFVEVTEGGGEEGFGEESETQNVLFSEESETQNVLFSEESEIQNNLLSEETQNVLFGKESETQNVVW